jgi:hypothetical protein
MAGKPARTRLGLDRIAARLDRVRRSSLSWQFASQVMGLIWDYKLYSIAIFAVTIFQEFAALWPVNLLGDFIDRLGSGDLGNVVWLLLGSSVFYPALLRANVILRHKMFYETDLQKRVELVFEVSDQGRCASAQEAGAAHTRVVNAVSGITNAAYHVLGSFTPVVIKIVIVAGSLLEYNRLLGIVYLVSLLIPTVMTLLFNKKLQVLRDSEYSLISDTSGLGIRVIGDKEDRPTRGRYLDSMRVRTDVFISLLAKSQVFLCVREVALVGSQFLVVFMALALRSRLNITPGDFTRIFGYTSQVAAAFINAAACLDAVISFSRAYHIFATAGSLPAVGNR